MEFSLLRRFDLYQKERFPLAILIFTTLSVVLSSAAVLVFPVKFINIIIVSIVALIYLFHMRVVDEKRDRHHDNLYHRYRPIQTGVISIKELKLIDIWGIFVFLAIAIFYGINTIIIALALLIYTFFAGRDFFLGYKFRRKFFLYNFINMFQIVMLQFFIYTAFAQNLYFKYIVWIHLVFVIINSIIIEIARKIKIKLEESRGKDTYSYYLGFGGSLFMCSVLAIINFILFSILVYLINVQLFIYFIISIPLILFLLISIVFHYRKQKKKSEKILFLSIILFYIGLNLIIYLSRIFSA